MPRTSTQTSTPSSMKYSLPAEWQLHEATWIGWPHQKGDWPGKMAAVTLAYGEIAKYICRSEKLRVIVQSYEHMDKAMGVLSSMDIDYEMFEFYHFETDRGWLRDSGPAFITNRTDIALVDFKFSGWAKYDNCQHDDLIPSLISETYSIPKFLPRHNQTHVCLEGGSIDVNGKGTLITTEECLMDPRVQVRNPGFTKQDYESVFKEYLGITNVLWLGKGIEGDDTHGHVDDVCRFVNAHTVVIAQENNERDSNYAILKENRERLKDFKLENGKKLQVVSLPMPEPVYYKRVRLPASYANFYICNEYVLVPTFNDPNDREALGILAELFPKRTVVGIHAVDLVWGLGTLHCLTREHPAHPRYKPKT